MDYEQERAERFLDKHAKERLEREMDIIEQAKKKHQQKKEETDWLKIISKGETYGSDTGRIGSELDKE